MEKYDLLLSQKNDIFKLITDSKFDPYVFIWEDSAFNFQGRQLLKTIRYMDTKYYFRISARGEGTFQGEFSPGDEFLIESYSTSRWPEVLIYVQRWLDLIVRENLEPDLWERVSKYQLPADIRLENNQENSKFDYSEVMQIIAGINELKRIFKNEFSIEGEQLDIINGQMDFLIEASKTQGRKAFYYLVVGNLFTVIATLSLSQEQGRMIWKTVKTMLLGLMKILPG